MKKHSLREQIKSVTDLNDRIYLFVVLISIILTLLTTIVTLAENSSPHAGLSVFVAFFIVSLIGYTSIKYNKMKIGKLILSYIFGCILLPCIYLYCEGINSGAPLYLLTSYFIIGLLLTGKSAIICYVVTLTLHMILIWIPYFYPNSFNIEPLSLEARYFDNAIAIVLVGFALFTLSIVSLDSYRKEHDSNKELLTKLKNMSEHDELSGLYNRRYLYKRLEELYSNNNDEINSYYIAMYDLDNFKNINDTYGHLFGDKIIVYFSDILKRNINEEAGELASRFGGEEFICIYKASTLDKAYAKAESIRLNLQLSEWSEDKNLTTTVSTGLVPCKKFSNTTQCLKEVDDLLYKAKESGKNQVYYNK